MKAQVRSVYLAAAVVLLPSVVSAFNLTGTWQGKVTCKQFGAAGLDLIPTLKLEETLDITQTGSALVVDSSNGFVLGAMGAAIDDEDKPANGQASLVGCENDGNVNTTSEEVGIFKVRTKPSADKYLIKGVSQHVDDDSTVTCKWKLTRTSALDPSASPCP